MTGKILAPFTADQVDALNAFQRLGYIHPFTCPGHEGGGDRDLIATRSGWICCHCAYRQDWAHAAMLNRPAPHAAPNPVEQIARIFASSTTHQDFRPYEGVWRGPSVHAEYLRRAGEAYKLAVSTPHAVSLGARPDRRDTAIMFAKIIFGNMGDTDEIFWSHLSDDGKRIAFELYDAAVLLDWTPSGGGI
jgi:hypothetical protein